MPQSSVPSTARVDPRTIASLVPPRDLLCLIFLALLPMPLLWSAVIGRQILAPAGQLHHFAAWSGPSAAPADGDSRRGSPGSDNLPEQLPSWDVLYWDDMAQLLPWQAEAQRALRHGRVPLWNHDAACGTPLLANSQTSALSPVWLVCQLGGIPRAQGWMAIFQLWLAGMGAYAFFRLHALRRLPCLTGAAVYQLSGWSLCWLEFPNRHAPVAWLPVCLWLLAVAFRRGGARVGSAAAALAISVLSSHLQFEFYLFLGLVIYTLAYHPIREAGQSDIRKAPGASAAPETPESPDSSDNGVSSEERLPGARSPTARWPGRIGILIGVVILAVLLASPQLLPTLELGHWSSRWGKDVLTWTDYSARMRFAMPGWWLAQAFVPGFFGVPSQGNMVSFLLPGHPPVIFFSANFYEFCVFVGIVPLYLAIHGLRQCRRDPLARFLAILGAIAVLLACGSILNAVLYFGLPGFSGMAGTARMLFLFAFAAAGLAAVGMQALPLPLSQPVHRASGAAKRALAALPLLDLALLVLMGGLFCAAAATAVSGFRTTYPDAGTMLADRASEIWLPAILLAGALGARLIIALAPSRRRAGEVSLFGLAVIQLLIFGQAVIRMAAPAEIFPSSPAIRAIQAQRPFRIMEAAQGWTLGPPDLRHPTPEAVPEPAPLPPNTADYYGLNSLESYDSLNTRAYVAAMQQLQGGTPAPAENGNLILLDKVESPLVERAGISLVISAAPLIAGGRRLEPLGIAGGVYLYRVRGARRPASVQPGVGAGRLTAPQIDQWEGGRIVLTGVRGPGTLVVLDAAAPGWSARVDGVPATIRTESGLFKSLGVGPGTHRVTLEYRPLAFRLGVFLSSLGLAVVMVLLRSAGGPGRWPGRSPRREGS